MKKLKKFCADNIGFTFILPALLFYTVFCIIAVLVTIYFSFFDWNGIGFHTMEFVGLKNYLEVFRDDDFWNSMKNNLIWLVLSCTLPLVLSLTLAVLLSSSRTKGKTFFRTVYFLPLMLSMPAVASIWQFIYNPTRGVIVWFMKLFGVSNPIFAWLGDPSMVMLALFIAAMWAGFGFNIVIFMAALQGVDPTYYEYALISGANRFQMTMKITIPIIAGVFTMILLNTIIGSFKVFDIIWVMTQGGPFKSSEVVAVQMYSQTFKYMRMGYGSTLGVVFTSLICVLSVLYVKYTSRWSNS